MAKEAFATGEAVDIADSEEVQVLFAREPTAQQKKLAQDLMLPLTFFCYQNDPSYCSDDQEDGEAPRLTFTSSLAWMKLLLFGLNKCVFHKGGAILRFGTDEDFETAVKKLNGKLYPDSPQDTRATGQRMI